MSLIRLPFGPAGLIPAVSACPQLRLEADRASPSGRGRGRSPLPPRGVSRRALGPSLRTTEILVLRLSEGLILASHPVGPLARFNLASGLLPHTLALRIRPVRFGPLPAVTLCPISFASNRFCLHSVESSDSVCVQGYPFRCEPPISRTGSFTENKFRLTRCAETFRLGSGAVLRLAAATTLRAPELPGLTGATRWALLSAVLAGHPLRRPILPIGSVFA